MCTDCGCALEVAVTPPPRGLHLELGQALLARNDSLAASLRQRFESMDLPVLNLLSSPGSGKTALLESLGRSRLAATRIGVIVGEAGDQ